MGIVLAVIFLVIVAWVLDGMCLSGCLYWLCWVVYGAVAAGLVMLFVSGVFRL